MRNADVAGEFVVVGGVSPSAFTYTWEGIVRKRRCRGVSLLFLYKTVLQFAVETPLPRHIPIDFKTVKCDVVLLAFLTC